MAEKKAKEVVIFIRVTPDIQKAIKEEAESQRRSMTKQLAVILEERYRKVTA